MSTVLGLRLRFLMPLAVWALFWWNLVGYHVFAARSAKTVSSHPYCNGLQAKMASTSCGALGPNPHCIVAPSLESAWFYHVRVASASYYCTNFMMLELEVIWAYRKR